jgi:glycosyltransferase involved in cell wall biosynthesis
MIVKNEEAHLAHCLDSVRGLVDEIIVVDTGSTDRTLAIAGAYQAKLFHFTWQDDFAAARNASLEPATGDWILQLDADEVLEPRSRAQLQSLLGTTSAEGLRLRVRNLTPPGDLQPFDEFHLTRLFRNRPAYRFEQPIHEQIRPSIERSGGRIRDTDLLILHKGYAQPSVQGGELRAARNLRLIKKALAGAPHDPYLYYQLGATYQSLGDQPAACQALQQTLILNNGQLDPTVLAKIYIKLAQLSLAADNYPATINYATQSLALNPENLVALYLMALAHMFQDQPRHAYPYFLRIQQSSQVDWIKPEDLNTVLAYCRQALNS